MVRLPLRLPTAMRLRTSSLGGPEDAAENEGQEPGLGIDEFRIVSELEIFDHSKRDTVRAQNLDLAFYLR